MVAESIKITLPLPHAYLSPNARVNWRGKAAKTKQYRAWACNSVVEDLYYSDRDAGKWEQATAQATFYHATNHRRDSDNLLASLKSAFDGIADAEAVADDSGITHLPVQCEIDKQNPRVEITITKQEPSDRAGPY